MTDDKHTTEERTSGPGVFDRECDDCHQIGLKRKQVPAPGGPQYKLVCPNCGATHDEEQGGYADRR